MIFINITNISNTKAEYIGLDLNKLIKLTILIIWLIKNRIDSGI